MQWNLCKFWGKVLYESERGKLSWTVQSNYYTAATIYKNYQEEGMKMRISKHNTGAKEAFPIVRHQAITFMQSLCMKQMKKFAIFIKILSKIIVGYIGISLRTDLSSSRH